MKYITLKGIALIAAVETGLLPEIEINGQQGYDTARFERFWQYYNKLAEEHSKPFSKNREKRP